MSSFELLDIINHLRIEKQAKPLLNHVKRSSVARDKTGSAIGFVLDQVDLARGYGQSKPTCRFVIEKTTCRFWGSKFLSFCWSDVLLFFFKLYVVLVGEDCRRFC